MNRTLRTLILAAVALAAAACQPDPTLTKVIDSATGPAAETTPVEIGEAHALERVDTLTVAAEHDAVPYSRDLYRHWTDADRDGCDTRQEVLISESLTDGTVDSRCNIVGGGTWLSAYDDVTVTDPSALDIDHMIPLAEAHRSGASTWGETRREQFANDLDSPQSLIAVTASTNRSKGDRDPAEWKPPVTAYHCEYATAWVHVKSVWGLTVDPVEKTALKGMLATC